MYSNEVRFAPAGCNGKAYVDGSPSGYCTKKKKVFLAPSTQFSEPGSGGVCPGYPYSSEADRAFAFANILKPKLEAAGFEVKVYPQPAPPVNDNLQIGYKPAAANAWGADFYLALHSDATGKGCAANGKRQAGSWTVPSRVFARGVGSTCACAEVHAAAQATCELTCARHAKHRHIGL